MRTSRLKSALILAAALAGVSGRGQSASAVVSTFASNGTYTVPPGINSLDVSLWGAGGGASGEESPGGAGAYVTGQLSVTPGEVLGIAAGGGGHLGGNFGVGAPGLGGTNGGGNGGSGGSGNASLGSLASAGGGGGGGYSGIFSSTTSFNSGTVLALAAGGGGGDGAIAGTDPLLSAIMGSGSFTGGTGGNGGASSGNEFGGGGGGGAGGGDNGGAPGGAGAPGASGGDGTDGASSGSFLIDLSNTSLSAVSTGSLPAGISDVNYNSSDNGAGGPTAAGNNGYVVIIPQTSVPEPASGSLLVLSSIALFARRRSKTSKPTVSDDDGLAILRRIISPF